MLNLDKTNHMRSLILSLTVAFAALSFTAKAQEATPSADAVVKEATAKAAKGKKKVFIIFHASWCGWCHKMDTAMADASCGKAFTDNYEIRHITVMENAPAKKADENPGGMELLTKYHGDKGGIPFWVILDAKGELLADSRMPGKDGNPANVGCPAQPAEVAYFINVLKKTSKMKPAELDAVQTRFAKIAPAH